MGGFHISGMIGSFVGLMTAFFVDTFHEIPLLNQLPALTFWVLPAVISLPFLFRSISRYTPKKRRVSVAARNGA